MCIRDSVNPDSPSKVLAVPDPVITLLSALLFIVVLVTVAKVESPLKNVDEFAVPDPNLAVGTVPEAILEAFKLVKDAPEPEKVVEVVTPDITNPLETVGAPFAILFVIKLVRILDILLF